MREGKRQKLLQNRAQLRNQVCWCGNHHNTHWSRKGLMDHCQRPVQKSMENCNRSDGKTALGNGTRSAALGACTTRQRSAQARNCCCKTSLDISEQMPGKLWSQRSWVDKGPQHFIRMCLLKSCVWNVWKVRYRQAWSTAVSMRFCL